MYGSLTLTIYTTEVGVIMIKTMIQRILSHHNKLLKIYEIKEISYTGKFQTRRDKKTSKHKKIIMSRRNWSSSWINTFTRWRIKWVLTCKLIRIKKKTQFRILYRHCSQLTLIKTQTFTPRRLIQQKINTHNESLWH